MGDTTETDWMTLRNGVDFTVRKMDGTTEVVKVRPITIRTAKEVLESLQDPVKAVEKFTGKPATWSILLEPTSLFELIEEGVRLNEPFFSAYKSGMDRVGKRVQEILGILPAV